MTNYRDQKACVNCKFVVELSYNDYACGKVKLTPMYKMQDVQEYVEYMRRIFESDVISVKQHGICDDYETNE